MDLDTIDSMIKSLKLDELIELESIPNIDLYMDQVITLFDEKLGYTKRKEDDKLLTKTMINNYIKDKLLMPAKKKKYTKEHIILMILLYEMKQILTISDIKSIFNNIVQNEKPFLYERFLVFCKFISTIYYLRKNIHTFFL